MKRASTTECAACGDHDTAVVEQHGPYRIRRCSACDLQFSDPMQASSADYADAYDRGEAPPEILGEGLPYLGWTAEAKQGVPEFGAFLTSAQQAALEALRARYPAGSHPVLEIGFGAGWFMGALRASGFEPYGIEAARAPVDVLRAKGFAVSTSATSEVPPEWPEPAVVVAFEVLEHLDTPLDFLSTMRRTHPRSDLVLSVPDERRWFMLGGREAHDYPPNHLTRWSPKALELALRRAGYEHAAVWRIPPTAQELSMAKLARFLPRRLAALRSRPAVGQGPERGMTTLAQELAKRRKRKAMLAPAALLLRGLGKTACSMVAMASQRPIDGFRR